MAGQAPNRTLLVSAFLAVYVIWGSTYLGIRFAVETMPPFLMAGVRWLVAGGLLYAWRKAAGDAAPTRAQWGAAAVVGLLMIVGGNGAVSFAQQFVPSGFAALLVAIVPVFIALLEWARTRKAPSPRVSVGVGLGTLGVTMLVGPAAFGNLDEAGRWFLAGILLVLGAAFSWAVGSLWSRRAPLPRSPLLSASMQMLAGGAALVVLGVGVGEASRVDPSAFSMRSWLAWGFLTLFGSIVAYSAYTWLLQVSRPELVATYAFVNPVVAVVLGALLAAETFTPLTFAAAAVIVAAVAIVVTAPRGARPAPAAPETALGKEFVLDTAGRRLHRRSRAGAACDLRAIPPGALHELDDEAAALRLARERGCDACPACAG